MLTRSGARPARQPQFLSAVPFPFSDLLEWFILILSKTGVAYLVTLYMLLA